MILNDLYWKFGVKKYETEEAFMQDLKAYTQVLAPELVLNPQEKIINAEEIEVICERDEEKVRIDIAAKDGKHLKLGELLLAINNDGFDFFEDQDVAYLEGMTVFDVQADPPIYKLSVRD